MKKIISICLAMLMAVAVTACNKEIKQSDSSQAQTTKTQTQTITDVLGREVKIPNKIEKIAAIQSAARMLTYAGAAEKLVGCTDMDKDGNPGMPYSYVNKEFFATLASVGSGGGSDTVYTEELVTLNPDVIFGFTTDIDMLDEVQAKTGIPVIGLYAKEIFDETFYQTLELIGSVMGTQSHCDEIVTKMKAWKDDLNKRTADIPDNKKPTVYTGAVSFKGAHGFDGTYGAYPPFVAIHANNVVDSTEKAGAMLIDLEKVSMWDPEIIFLNPVNMNMVNEDYKKNPAFYEHLSAVKNGKIYSQVSFNFNSCNMEIAMVDAYYAGSVIYPEAFSDLNFEDKAEEIFTAMIGQTYLPVLTKAGFGFGQLTIGE